MTRIKTFYIILLSGGLLGTLFFLGPFAVPGSSICPACHAFFPDNSYFVAQKNPPHFAAFSKDKKTGLLGYVFLTHELAPGVNGFAGPIKMAVAVDPRGNILGVRIMAHAETPDYVEKLEDFLKQFISRNAESSFAVGKDIDAITGATVTSRAVTDAIAQSLHVMAVKVLKVTSDITPVKGLDAARIRQKIQNAGLTPRQAGHWKELPPHE